jgi:hypothetical protein
MRILLHIQPPVKRLAAPKSGKDEKRKNEKAKKKIH